MTIKTSVIIGAGMGTRLEGHGHLRPKGFLEVGERAIIEESLDHLVAAGIERVVIVTGHQGHYYEDLAEHSNGLIETINNPDYATTGSMYSLYCARDLVDCDFLLLESDLIYEQLALDEILQQPEPDIVLMSSPTHSGDEVWIESPEGKLRTMSKNVHEVGAVDGELVGICKISKTLFEAMCADAAAAFDSSPGYCYETDCLVSVGKNYPIHCHRVDHLIWSEIDNATHLRRARDLVYPKLMEVDREIY
jgi:choline kinase